MNEHRILDGIRVLDVTQVVAGPAATRMLADLGATVTRIDRPAPGGATRPRRAAGPPTFNVGKRSVILDLKHPEGREAARALARVSDVLVENFAPGVMDRLGLGYPELSAENPRLIYASISGFGHGNSRSHRRAFGATAHAEAGWLWVQQQAQGGTAPFAPGVTVADIATGMNVVTAVLAGLYDRERTGRGTRIDLSLMEGQLGLLAEVARGPLADEKPGDWQPFRHGLQATSDGGYLTVNIGPPHNWDRLAAAFDRPGTAQPSDPAAAAALLGTWIGESTTDDAARRLEAAGAPYGVVRTMAEAVADPWLAERDMIRTVDDPLDGPTRVLNSPLRFSTATVGPVSGAPLAGEHTRTALAEAGLAADAIDRLLGEGAAEHYPAERA